MRRILQRVPDTAGQRAAAAPTAAKRKRPSDPLAELQAQAGNEVVNRLVDGHIIQNKLIVGSVDDLAEGQADRVADALVQRLGKGLDADADAAAEAAPPELAGALHPVHEVLRRGGGSPLDAATRSAMEGHLGADLGSVRLHLDALSADAVNARAYTVGENVVVHPRQFSPGSRDTAHLLAHELTHVVQQRSGPVTGRPAPGGLVISEPSDRFEVAAEASARAAMDAAATGGPKRIAANGGQAHLARMTVQRDAVGDWLAMPDDERAGRLEAVTYRLKDFQKAKKANDLGLQLFWASQAKMTLAELRAHGGAPKATLRKTLATEIDTELTRIKTDIRAGKKKGGKTKKDLTAFESYITMEGESGKYAWRNVESAKTGQTPGGFLKGLSMGRGPGGALTDTAIRAMEDEQIAKLDELKTKFLTAGVVKDKKKKKITPKQAKAKLQAEEIDKFTEDAYEYRAYEAGTGKGKRKDKNILSNDPANQVTQPFTLGGATVTITYDTTDVLFAPRLAALTTALDMVAARLAVPIPAFSVLMPKFSFKLTPGAKGQIEVHEIGNRAEFFFPDTLVLTAGAMDAKVTTSISYQEYERAEKLGEYEAKRGITTIAHEIGHLVHYKLNRSAFLNLQMSGLKGETASGENVKQYLVKMVSEYGGANPREAVAEIFTGTVVGRHYNPELMAMYAAFGGPPLTAPIDAKVADEFASIVNPKKLDNKTWISDTPTQTKEKKTGKLAPTPYLEVRGLSDGDYDQLKKIAPKGSPDFKFYKTTKRVEIFVSYQVLRELYPEFQAKLTDLTGKLADINTVLDPSERKLAEKSEVETEFMTGKAKSRQTHSRESLDKFARKVATEFDFKGYEKIFGGKTLDEVRPVIEGLTRAEDLVAHVFSDLQSSGMVLAESHSNPAQKEWLLTNLPVLQRWGVNTIYLEHFRYNEHQAMIDADLDGKPSPQFLEFVKRLDGNKDNGPIRQILDYAREHKMRVVGADHSSAARMKGGTLEERALRMNTVAATIIRNDLDLHKATRYVYLVGSAHAKEHSHSGLGSIPGVDRLLGVPVISAKGGGGGVELVSGKRHT